MRYKLLVQLSVDRLRTKSREPAPLKGQNTVNQRVVQRELIIEAVPKIADADLEETVLGELLSAYLSKQVIKEIPTMVRSVKREQLTQLPDLREAETAVLEAALHLRDSGYDGPFIGDVCVPLFSALAEWEKAVQEEGRRHKCGACNACEIEAMGCGCDGAYDDGCFLCNPAKYTRPLCPS